MISILHVIADLFAKGGTPRKLLSLVEARNKDRFSHIFLVFNNRKDNLNEEMRQCGGSVIDITMHRNYDFRLLSNICGVVRNYDVDLISTHFARADIYGAIAGMVTRTPVVRNVHGMLWNESRFLQRLDALLTRFRACTVCNSYATRNAVIRQIGAKNTIVIHNGIPNRAVSLSNEEKVRVRNNLGIPQDAFVIGHVGGLIPLRDQNLILSALQRLLDNSVNAYLVFVGDGPLGEDLEAEASRLNITKRVRFLGYRDDVPVLLSILDTYVNMAREEGFGIAVVEAMQAGLPVVLANAGALPELIENGLSGLLVPASDSDDLAKALQRLANDGELRNKLGEEARRRARIQFSISRYVKDMEQLYIEFGSGDARK